MRHNKKNEIFFEKVFAFLGVSLCVASTKD